MNRSFVEAKAEIDQIYDTMIRLRWATLAGEPFSLAESPARSTEAPAAMSPSVKTIFVVDDNASLRKALSRLFRSVDYTVETFATAQAFLDRKPVEHPACVVLDVRMPRMSGLDLQAELASAGSDLPIIFITGHGDIDMAVRAMKDGAVDFLPKPFDDQDLLDSVERALESHVVIRQTVERRRELEQRAERLTPREREVFELVVQGKLNKQIGFDLGTTEKTIKVHRARVMEKMEAGSLADLVRIAADLGINPPAVDGI